MPAGRHPKGGPTEFTLPEVEAIVDEAGRVGRNVAAHAQGTDGSIAHGYDPTEDLADRIARTGSTWCRP